MNVTAPTTVVFPSTPTQTQPTPELLQLENVMNVTFMTIMETPDLSCVYRVRSGESARSIVKLALIKRLKREPAVAEIESYLHEVKEINNNDIEALKPGDIFFLPIDHQHALGHNVQKACPSANVSRHAMECANSPRPADVRLVIAPPGMEAAPGTCIIKDNGVVVSRTTSQPEVDEINATVTYTYQGELCSSFLGLFRSFFAASETRNSLGKLLSSSIEYDGFGASLKFMTIAGVIVLPLVRSIDTKYDDASDLYETIVTCADGMKHTLASSPDGKRTWRV